MASSNKPAITPESRVRAPAFALTTVRTVAPAPGRPPISAAPILPTPCPMSSRRESCLVRVMLSATTLVSKESIAPSAASVAPY